VSDSPSVGENLRDHWKLRLQFRIVRGKGYNHRLSGFRWPLNYWRYRLFRSGIMASAASEIAAFVKVLPNADRADAQLQISLSSTEPGQCCFRAKARASMRSEHLSAGKPRDCHDSIGGPRCGASDPHERAL
jgi:choline dehydrogenase-like flavoprotein